MLALSIITYLLSGSMIMDKKIALKTGARVPFRLKRFLEVTAPEAVWMGEIISEAGMDLRTRQTWLKRLNSANAFVRQEAKRDFQALPPAAQLVLTIQAYARAQMHTLFGGTLMAVGGIMAILIGYGMGRAPGFLGGLVVSAVMGSIVTSYLVSSRMSETAKNLLDNSQDVRLVPFLLMWLAVIRAHSRAIRQISCERNLRNALARLLPNVQEADTAVWAGAHWNHLLYYLRNPFADVELTCLTLQIVARFGNGEAARQVHSLRSIPLSVSHRASTGQRRAALESSKSLIEQVAAECLPGLEERLEQQRQAQTLLRASGSESAPATDILLRPAIASVSETPAEQLLRPQSVE
jgi:hypothetical protein